MLALLFGLHHYSAVDYDAAHMIAIALLLRFHPDCRVGGIRDQALLSGTDRVEQTLAGEGAVFLDVEGAAVERKTTGVIEPKRAQHA